MMVGELGWLLRRAFRPAIASGRCEYALKNDTTFGRLGREIKL